jgi:hypothetical protein
MKMTLSHGRILLGDVPSEPSFIFKGKAHAHTHRPLNYIRTKETRENTCLYRYNKIRGYGEGVVRKIFAKMFA